MLLGGRVVCGLENKPFYNKGDLVESVSLTGVLAALPLYPLLLYPVSPPSTCRYLPILSFYRERRFVRSWVYYMVAVVLGA